MHGEKMAFEFTVGFWFWEGFVGCSCPEWLLHPALLCEH